jgi:hypothetical protein
MHDAPEETTQYGAAALAELLASAGPLRISLQLTDAAGEVLLDHRCQPQGLVHELKMRLWRKVRAVTEPLTCAFYTSDNPGSTFVYQCREPLDDGRLFVYVTVPGGALRVPACPEHRAALEARERQFNE